MKIEASNFEEFEDCCRKNTDVIPDTTVEINNGRLTLKLGDVCEYELPILVGQTIIDGEEFRSSKLTFDKYRKDHYTFLDTVACVVCGAWIKIYKEDSGVYCHNCNTYNHK